MKIDDSPFAPIFLDEDDDKPLELPLMVTRCTLRSTGLLEKTLKYLNPMPVPHSNVIAPDEDEHSDQLNRFSGMQAQDYE